MGFAEQVLAVGVVLTLLAATLRWLRRGGMIHLKRGSAAKRPVRSLELVERLPVAPQHVLHLVRLGSRAFLIGRSPSGLSLLDSFEWSRVEEESNGSAERAR